jgi:hypothetical protein
VRGPNVRPCQLWKLRNGLRERSQLRRQHVHVIGVARRAYSKAVRWGALRDSDAFAGVTATMQNQNYCVSFELPVP